MSNNKKFDPDGKFFWHEGVKLSNGYKVYDYYGHKSLSSLKEILTEEMINNNLLKGKDLYQAETMKDGGVKVILKLSDKQIKIARFLF